MSLPVVSAFRWAKRLWPIASYLVIIGMLLGAAVAAPYLTSYAAEGLGDPNPSNKLLPPSSAHLFGTDHLGRDLYARVLFGAQASLSIGTSVVLIAVGVGLPLGLFAGYLGGWVDEIITRLAEAFMAFPQLLLAIAFATTLGASLTSAIIAISLIWWPWYVRLARSLVLPLRHREYLVAAQALGATPAHILARHVLPNMLSPILISATADVGSAILTGAALSFLGLGVPPPLADWGQMISASRSYFPDHWWYALFPGLALFITALVFGLLGEELQAMHDPRLRNRQ